MEYATPSSNNAPAAPVEFFRSFRVCTKLAIRDVLKTISGDALRLFIYLSRRFHGGRSREVVVSDFALELALGLDQMQVDEARYELSVIGVLTYELLDGNSGSVRYIHLPD